MRDRIEKGGGGRIERKEEGDRMRERERKRDREKGKAETYR